MLLSDRNNFPLGKILPCVSHLKVFTKVFPFYLEDILNKTLQSMHSLLICANEVGMRCGY